MATPTHDANLPAWSWRRPSRFLRAAPRALVWTATIAFAWAILRAPLTLLAGMVRSQPPGSETYYLVGVAVGITIDLAVYGFLLGFLALRRERWAQALLIAAALVQATYWIAQLARSTGVPVAVPGNFPDFANPPLVARNLMYGISAAFTLLIALLASFPGVWRWTRRRSDASGSGA